MKPQDSKDISSRSSPTQEGASAQGEASAEESLEELIARLMHSSVQTEEEHVAPSSEELQTIITGLEDDLATGHWINSYYEDTDIRVMPALVKKANSKYPDMNLKLALTAEEFSHAIKEVVESDAKSARFIVNSGSKIHFAVLDYQKFDDKISLIMLEPTTFQNIAAAKLGIKINQTLETLQLPPYSFTMAEMDIQRSSSECGMFSLSLAKKLHTESQKLERLHKDNVKGVLCDPNSSLSAEKLDSYLPVSLYKHAQGRRRLEQYLKTNPQAIDETVNKKGETIRERFEKNLKEEGAKNVSVSPHKKRITEYKSLMM
ncbi:YopJ family type III secretion system effector serine/threonine acetyltransferase [Bartonella kosoyi]|uniref:YopJ family type III secretion system effector serine/threonine acetyltransferase n=1 Tax=Bartonella kosoyi TaxID=2133959 RepID=A0A5B9CZT6_9HYPH|nr:YopJ/AvrA family T3SS effector serine/threonine acetyltransferase [Bartonella kosoyi]QEE09805.1 YopJ family type III secretion system effector serine/threonine acetyltransferase [Bartonella kosoyi]